MRLQNKTAIVTGAASGIGQQTAVRMAAEGVHVLAIDICKTGLENTQNLAKKTNLAIDILQCDVSIEADVQAVINKAAKLWNRIDILVNIAGIQITKPLQKTSFADFNQMMAINMGGTFLFCKAVLPYMEKAGSGSIINLASELAFVGYSDLAVYTATKGAMISFTRSIALEAIRHGVRINCVCPGATDTPIFWEGETDPVRIQEMLDRVKEEKPIGRLITTDEVANGIIFMASDEASGVVGTCLVIDGGFTTA